MSGLKIAAFYSLPPHLLGLCGPKRATERQILLRFLQGEVSITKIRKVFQRFKGAYPYYKLIARSNKIKDPLNKKVVRAYWIGNNLLDKVKINDLKKMIRNEFSEPGLLPQKTAIKKAKLIPIKSMPHHSFHVLVIGSVTGSVDFKNTKLKDICRVGWGKVIKKLKIKNRARTGEGEDENGVLIAHKKLKILVRYQPLVGNKKIKLGRSVKKEILWDKELVPKVKIGDRVSFHWNWLVQILTKKDVANLKKYTLNTLKSL